MATIPCTQCGQLLAPGTYCPKDGTKIPRILSLEKGLLVDKYILEAPLDAGGMGEVWRARHKVIRREIAIKFLHPRFISDEPAIERFRREALAVNEIRHKYLVDIYDFGELSDGRPYFVMEYLEGQKLSEYIEEKGPLPFSKILTILDQVCQALFAVHECGITHRDLKPDNIFLCDSPEEESGSFHVKIFDFGIAKLAETPDKTNSLTKTGAVFGTPAYMSPEQCEGAKAVDPLSDIYSLGIILFEMLTGRTPFHAPGDGLGTVMAKQISLQPFPPSKQVSGRKIPSSIDSFLLKVLAKNPKKRPQSAKAFFQKLSLAASSLQHEKFNEISDAKPLFEKEPLFPYQKTSDTPEQQNITQTGDYFASSPDLSPHLFSTSPLKNWKTILLSSLLAVAFGSGIVYFFFGTPKNRIQTPQTVSVNENPAQASPSLQKPLLPETSQAILPPDISQPGSTISRPESLPKEELTNKLVSLKIESTPKGGSVFRENTLLGKTPLEMQIPFQEETLTLRLERKGYELKILSFTPNEDISLTPRLVPIVKTTSAKKPPPAKATPNKKDKDDDGLFVYEPKKK